MDIDEDLSMFDNNSIATVGDVSEDSRPVLGHSEPTGKAVEQHHASLSIKPVQELQKKTCKELDNLDISLTAEQLNLIPVEILTKKDDGYSRELDEIINSVCLEERTKINEIQKELEGLGRSDPLPVNWSQTVNYVPGQLEPEQSLLNAAVSNPLSQPQPPLSSQPYTVRLLQPQQSTSGLQQQYSGTVMKGNIVLSSPAKVTPPGDHLYGLPPPGLHSLPPIISQPGSTLAKFQNIMKSSSSSALPGHSSTFSSPLEPMESKSSIQILDPGRLNALHGKVFTVKEPITVPRRPELEQPLRQFQVYGGRPGADLRPPAAPQGTGLRLLGAPQGPAGLRLPGSSPGPITHESSSSSTTIPPTCTSTTTYSSAGYLYPLNTRLQPPASTSELIYSQLLPSTNTAPLINQPTITVQAPATQYGANINLNLSPGAQPSFSRNNLTGVDSAFSHGSPGGFGQRSGPGQIRPGHQVGGQALFPGGLEQPHFYGGEAIVSGTQQSPGGQSSGPHGPVAGGPSVRMRGGSVVAQRGRGGPRTPGLNVRLPTGLGPRGIRIRGPRPGMRPGGPLGRGGPRRGAPRPFLPGVGGPPGPRPRPSLPGPRGAPCPSAGLRLQGPAPQQPPPPHASTPPRPSVPPMPRPLQPEIIKIEEDDEPEIIEVENPTLDKLKACGISVSRDTTRLKQPRIPRGLKLPPGQKINQSINQTFY